MASWLDRLKKQPSSELIAWVLDKACPSIQYRLLTEVMGKGPTDPQVHRAREGAANTEALVKISRAQKETGVWLDKVLEFEAPNPSRNRGPAMINQYLALVEHGWDGSHPIIHCSAERLLNYLTEDPKADLFELKGYAGTNPKINVSIRRCLSLIAAALLSRSGYASHPGVTAAAERVLAELDTQYPAKGEPSLYEGVAEIEEGDHKVQLRVVKEGVHPPDMFLFYLLAFHPLFTATPAARAVVHRVVQHLMKGDSLPRRVRESEGRRWIKIADLSIANWQESDYSAGKIGFLLHDLELLARTGTLPAVPRAMQLLDWLLAMQGEDGVFKNDPGLEKQVTRSQYHYFPLEDSWRGKHKKYTDFCFRMILILKILDRTAPLS